MLSKSWSKKRPGYDAAQRTDGIGKRSKFGDFTPVGKYLHMAKAIARLRSRMINENQID